MSSHQPQKNMHWHSKFRGADKHLIKIISKEKDHGLIN